MLVGGGTGGHLFPALAIAEVAEQLLPDLSLFFIACWTGLERQILQAKGKRWIGIPSRSFPGKLFSPKTVGSLTVLIQGVGRLVIQFRSVRPQLVIGTGGYVSLPAVIAGKLVGARILFVEANSIPGRTHRILSRFADLIVTGFPEAVSFFPKGKALFTGLPVRSEFLAGDRTEARRPHGLTDAARVLLVMGGSQGARRINEAVFDAVTSGLINDPSLHLFHLCGRRWESGALAIKESLPPDARDRYHPIGFLDPIAPLFHAADLLVSRAGAGTIAEALAACLPSVLVPYPYAIYDHQRFNALSVSRKGAAQIVNDAELTGSRLSDELRTKINATEVLDRMRQAAMQIRRPDAATRVVDLCLNLMSPSNDPKKR